jgi:hypothetical protein
VCMAAHLFAARLAKIAAFFRSYPGHMPGPYNSQAMECNRTHRLSYTFPGSFPSPDAIWNNLWWAPLPEELLVDA